MAIYSSDGSTVYVAYDSGGGPVYRVYSASGEEIAVSVEPLDWDMSETYKSQVLNVLDYISNYKQGNPSAYALCQFNDGHQIFGGNEPNFIDYNNGFEVLDRMLFVGDMTDSANASQYAKAVAFMEGASASKRLVAMGNHEYGSYSASAGDPEALYRAVINVGCTYKTDSALIYYHDDEDAGIRFIALDYFFITKIYTDGGHLLDLDQAAWLAGVLETAGDKDIIIFAHSMLNPFYIPFIDDTRSSTATLQNADYLISIINAYKNRQTYSIEVDGNTYSYDYSEATGDFIMYTSGHYHAFGYSNDDGFNMFTCPSLKNGYPLGTNSKRGFTFFLIDRELKTIKAFVCSVDLDEYAMFSYTY